MPTIALERKKSAFEDVVGWRIHRSKVLALKFHDWEVELKVRIWPTVARRHLGALGPQAEVQFTPKRSLAAASSSVRDNLFGVECVLLGDRDWTP